MSITNVEVNFASNGSPHSATVTEVLGTVVCGGAAPEMISRCAVSNPILINNDQINSLLKNFVLESKTTTVDPRSRKKEYKLIDKVSEKLERIVVLVRGINAPSITEQFGGTASFLNTTPPNSQLKFEGPLFACSELPFENFTLMPPSLIRGYGTYGEDNSVYDEDRNLVILGATYNVISQEIRNEKSYQVYNKGIKIEALELDSRFTEIQVIEREDEEPIVIDPTENQRIDATKSTLKFGYTSKEFFDALEAIGIEFADNPLRNKGDNLFDTSGSLKDCLAAITGYYGYYWYVDMSEDGVVKILDSNDVHSIQIEDPTLDEDPDILSASFSEGGRSPFVVSSFMGSTSRIDEDSTSFEMKDRPTSRRFWKLDFNQAFEFSLETRRIIGLFYNFFYSSAADDEDSLKKYIFACQHVKPDIMKGVEEFSDGIAEEGVKALLADLVDADNSNNSNNPPPPPQEELNNDNAYFLSQMSANGKAMPDRKRIMSFLKLYFDFLGSIYISNGYSRVFTERNEFSGGATSVSGPYAVNSAIASYPDTKDIAEFVGLIAPAKAATVTFAELMRAADIQIGINAGFVYIARAPKKGLQEEDKDEAIKTFGEDLTAKCRLNTTVKGKDYLVVDKPFYTTLESAINNSSARLSRMLKRIPASVKASVANINTTPDGDSSDGEGERVPMEFVYQKVKTFGKNKFCKTELKSLNGTIQDVKILEGATNEQLGVIQNELNSSSTTYAGLRIPEEIDISIDSISIQFGDGGISTTISKSNKNILPLDQNIILSKGKAQTYSNYRFSAGARNFFKLN